jgi:hypothetical protein
VNELVKIARGFNSGLRAFIVLSRISPNPSVTERAEAEEAIKDFEDLELAPNPSFVTALPTARRLAMASASTALLVANRSREC